MATERMAEHTGACPCGKGTLEIECCSSDNGYRVYPDFYEAHVVCPECRKKYSIEQVGKAFHLVHKTDLERIASKKAEYSAAAKKLSEEARQAGVISAFVELLDSQTSAAARHRILQGAGMEYSSLATFRKRWSNGAAYLEAHGSDYNVGKILAALKSDNASLTAKAAGVEALRHEAYAKPPVIHPPIHIAD